MPTYRFTDDWYVATDPPAARELLRRVQEWPTWWPSALSVAPAPPQDPRSTGEGWRFTFQTRLPYQMSFQADVVHEEPLALDTTVVGRVRGEGGWRVSPFGDGAQVHFDWSVDPQVRWMRLLSPLARPVFVWNHRSLMAEGARSFADELATTMPRQPRCTPSLAAAALQVALGSALLLGLVLASSRRSVRRRTPRPAGG